MLDETKSKRERSPNEGEFIFEQWSKWLAHRIIDEDILHDTGTSSEFINNITLEQLRGLFALGYRFAMSQVLRKSKNMYRITHDDIDINDYKELLKIIKSQQSFIHEKIDDSFTLNRLEKNFKLSKILKENHEEDLENRNTLTWANL